LPLNASELHARLRGISPKSLLAGIILAGFFLTLPVWLASTPEQKQQLAHTTTASQVVQKGVGLLDIRPEEQERLVEMLKPATKADVDNFEKAVWLQDLKRVIRPYVSDDTTAQDMARWVYIYGERFDLSPELLLGVISVESHFDHFAISKVGARGLMQVMPFWKKKLGSEGDNLFNIETNIRYGSAILRMYLDRYGKISSALAAYNGSLGRHKYPQKVFKEMDQFSTGKLNVAG